VTASNTISADMAEAMMTPRAEGHDIPHLLSPVLMGRQALAAHFLRNCTDIVELGGHKAPITPFLMHGPKSVVSVDPKIVPLETDRLHGRACQVRHIAAKFQQVDFDVEPFEYGLVMLGYSMKGYGAEQAVNEQLMQLVDAAKVTVIDHVVDFARADTQLPALLDRGTVREVCRLDIQFHDAVVEGLPYANRRMLVFEPAAA
jgi:hypothetical protein